MKILVTGGAGFIGSHIADAYLAAGHEVHILDNLSTGKRENIPAAATFHELDLNDPEVAELLAFQQFEVINHQAAQMDVRRSVADPVFDAQTNILGTLQLLQGGLKAGLKKFIFASSGGVVYGEQVTFPATESHPTNPISPYGVAKLTVEKYLHYFYAVQGLEYLALRYANVYGPRQSAQGEAGVVAIFANRMMNGQQPVINGDGRQTRDYVMVEDVVHANVLSLSYPGVGAFNIGTGIETDVVQIFDTINAFTGQKMERKFGPAKAGEQRRSVLSYKKIQTAMGWTPHYNFTQGMNKTLEWFSTSPKT